MSDGREPVPVTEVEYAKAQETFRAIAADGFDCFPVPSDEAGLSAEVSKHGKEYEFKSYPADSGHGFFADYRPSYRQESAVDGWQRIFDFYARYLK